MAIYAPNAKVTLAGSAISGAIASDRTVSNGRVSISYPSTPVEDILPEGVFRPDGENSSSYRRGLWSSRR